MDSIIDRTKHKIEVMQAYLDGKTIQIARSHSDWQDCETPAWNWAYTSYRVKPLEKPFIDWSQIPDAYRWLAVDQRDTASIFINKPVIVDYHWFPSQAPTSTMVRIDHIHTSYKRGTVNWRDSLVERPE